MQRKWFVAVAVVLAGCGGGGGGGGDDRPSSKVFVADSFNRAIGSMINANPVSGIYPIDRFINGPATGLDTASGSLSSRYDLALDAASDRLYVATGASVRVWDNAGFANGNQPPSRVITSQVTRGGSVFPVDFSNLFIDTANNRLYAAELNGEVHVYNNASSASGLLAPSRSITPDVGSSTIVSTFGVAVDLARDMLYVGVDTGSARILVFHNQSSLNTSGGSPRAPDRTILVTDVRSLYLDAAGNRLYTAQTSGIIRIFDGASTLNGGVVANRTFTLGTSEPDIFVDTVNDRLYCVGGNLVFIVPNASTASGAVTATVVAVQLNTAFFSAIAVKP